MFVHGGGKFIRCQAADRKAQRPHPHVKVITRTAEHCDKIILIFFFHIKGYNEFYVLQNISVD